MSTLAIQVRRTIIKVLASARMMPFAPRTPFA